MPIRAAQAWRPETPIDQKESTKGQLIAFDVISLDKAFATVRWRIDVDAEVHLSLFVRGRTPPVLEAHKQSLAMVEQELTFDGLLAGTDYRIVAKLDCDRREIGFKTNEAWMQ